MELESYDDRPTARGGSLEAMADELVDELMPEELDWRDLVCRYPRASLTLAAVAGFFLGRNHGTVLLGAVTTYAVNEISSNVARIFGDAVGTSSSADEEADDDLGDELH